MYAKASDIKRHWEQNKSRPLNFSAQDEAELEAALKESLKTMEAEDRARGLYNQQSNDDDTGGMVGSVLHPGKTSS